MRSPTAEEIGRLQNELHKGFLDRLNRKEIALQVCTVCGTWAAETWDSQQKTVVRQFIVSPFKFNIGDRVKVTLEGKHRGMVGIIGVDRQR